jgi:hypothetical protein
MRAGKDRERLATSSEIADLGVGAGQVPVEVQLFLLTLEQKRNMARRQPRRTMADKQAEIISVDMPDQHLWSRFGEGGR